MKELVARVRARRGAESARRRRRAASPIEVEELRIDPREVQAYVDGRAPS